MDFIFPKSYKKMKKYLKDPLYKNSIYILLTMVMSGLIGFLYWIIAAKYYSPDVVGINTALISSMNLIVLLSYLGLDQSIIRFFPEGNKFNIFVTSIIIIVLSNLILGIIFIFGIEIFSPNLVIVKNFAFPFLISLLAFSLTQPTAQTFIALRKSQYYFYQNIFLGLRLILIFIPFLGKFGIFISFGVSAIIATIFSFYYIYKLDLGKPVKTKLLIIDLDYLKSSFNFSMGNYFLIILLTAPNYLLPIIVLNVLGSEQTASYYISYNIASVLFFISAAFSTSLFVEGSHGESLKLNAIKTLKATFLVLIPLAVLLFYYGGLLLNLIGKSYLNGFELLRLIVISSFFYSVCMIFFSIRRIQKKMKDLIIASSLIFVLIIGLSYPLLLKYGINGIGYAFIISYFASAVYILIRMKNIFHTS